MKKIIMPFQEKRNRRDDKSTRRSSGAHKYSSRVDDNQSEKAKNFVDQSLGRVVQQPFKERVHGRASKKVQSSPSSFDKHKKQAFRPSRFGEAQSLNRRGDPTKKGSQKSGFWAKRSTPPDSSHSANHPSGEKKLVTDRRFSSPQGFKRQQLRDKPNPDSAIRTHSKREEPLDEHRAEERLRPNNRARSVKPAKKEVYLVRLNRYLANAGVCSRRKADDLIIAGLVSINGESVVELGFKVNPAKDVIRYNGEILKREKMVYVLLNKPKDYITTTEDPQERRTVMSLVEKASYERIYPVGRLDRNTTGLLLFTNDGDLAEKLSHPRNQVRKIYQVHLNKNLTQGDFNKISYGIELEDGLIKPDAVSYVNGAPKNEIGIQIHSGKNRIVRRIFEHLGYEVMKLDRVIYGNLTKKDLGRGDWRYLQEKEVIQLKHLMQIAP